MRYKLEVTPREGGPIRKNGNILKTFGNCTVTYRPVVGKNGALLTGFDHTPESVKEREELEDLLQINRDGLKPTSTYWDSFQILIPDHGVYLDTDSPVDALKIKVLKADPDVAKSTNEYEAAPNRYLFILTSEQLEAETKNSKRETKIKAYAAYDSLSHNERKDVLLLYGKSSQLLNAMTDSVIYNELGDEVDKDPQKFLTLVSDELYKSKATIIRYVNKGLLQRGSAKKTYDQELLYNGESLGLTLNQVAEFLLNKNNVKIKKALELQYNSLE